MDELHFTEEMYQENILDHYKNPRNKKEMPSCTHFCKQNNPLCGDEVEMFLQIIQGRVADVSFTGQGCALSQASASLLTESIKNKSLADVSSFNKQKIFSLLGISISPLRQNCALLSLRAVQQALSQASPSQALLPQGGKV